MTPWGSKSAKSGRKCINFGVLELSKVTEGSDMVALETKKFHTDEEKLFGDKTFFLKILRRALETKNAQECGGLRRFFIISL